MTALRWLLLALFLLTAPVAEAAVAVSGTPTEASNTATNTATWSHTVPTGSTRLLLVTVGMWDPLGQTSVSSVTYGGAALARVTGLTPPNQAGGGLVDIWYRLAPVEGTANIVVTLADVHAILLTGAVDFTGVDQTTPFGTPATATGTAATITVNVSSATGELVVDAVKAFRTGHTALSPGADQTEQFDINSGATDSHAASTEAGATTVTMSWTYTDGVATDYAWAIAGVALKPAAGGGGSPAPTRNLLGVGQ